MAKGCALSTGYLPRGGLPRNSVDRITDRPDMTSAADRGRKASTQKQTNKVSKDNNITYLFLEGTTGFPKGATLTHHNIVNNSFFTGLRCGYHEKVVCILCVFHLFFVNL